MTIKTKTRGNIVSSHPRNEKIGSNVLNALWSRRIIIHFIHVKKASFRSNKANTDFNIKGRNLPSREVKADFYCEDLGHFRDQNLTFGTTSILTVAWND